MTEDNNAPENAQPKIQIKRPGDAPPAPKIKLSPKAAKHETTRIDLADALAENDADEAVAPIPVPSEGIQHGPDYIDEAKSSTVRIDMDLEDIQPDERGPSEDAALNSTRRIELDGVDQESVSGKTQPIDAEEIVAAQFNEANKKRTARINISEVLGKEAPEDVFAQRTTSMDPAELTPSPEADTEPHPPRTIRIKRPDAPPATTILKKSPESTQSETVVEASSDENAKSETARIDLPPEVMAESPTRRKTIRIKRPDSTSAPTLNIARPSKDGKGNTKSVAPSSTGPTLPPIPTAQVEEGVGVVFPILALVATLVIISVTYFLAAQMFNLPPAGSVLF